MANKTQTEMLKGAVSAWNSWRTEHADLQPDLAEAHLHGLDLMGANLDKADLRRADLRGTNLSDASLVGAHLEGAKFLTGDQLMAAKNWQSAYRDQSLACGAPIPADRS